MVLDQKEYANVRQRAIAMALFAVLLFALPICLERTAVAQTASGSTDLVISQVYARGGEPGAALRNDFIEFFNRGANNVDLADYSLVISTTGSDATPDTIISFVSSTGIIVVPGEYLLFQLGSSGNNGAFTVVAPEFSDVSINLGSTAGKIALVQSKSLAPLGCPVGQDPAVDDYVAYGAASCAEGAVPAAATATANIALVRKLSGCTDTDNNAADFTTAGPTPRNEFTLAHVCTPPIVPNAIQFEVNHVDAVEGQGSAEIFVTRSGDTSAAATVQYATIGGQPTRQAGKATDRSDYTTAIGTLRFAAGESRKSFRIIITDDGYFDGVQRLVVRLGTPTGGGLGARSSMTVDIADNETQAQSTNPIDTSSFFVRQHYADFLGRDPDTAGLNFWTNEIEVCGTDAACRELKRINVSAAFYLSVEFQETGFLVYRLFKAAYPENASRLRGFPSYREFLHDTQDIGRGVTVGQGNWQVQLEANKKLEVLDFVERPEFKLRYPVTMTPAQFVDALNTNANGALSASERDALVLGLQNGTETRATVLRRVADDDDFRAAELNKAFVLMEYFGYERRSPNDAPDLDFSGYNFWLIKLNQFNGNFIQAEMVKAFLLSSEYRVRFASQ